MQLLKQIDSPLLLTSAKIHASFAHNRLEFIWKLVDKREGVRLICYFVDLLHAYLARIGGSIRNIISDRHGKEHGLLWHRANVIFQIFLWQRAYVAIANFYLSLLRIIVAQNERGECGLSAATRSYYGQNFAARYHKIQVFQNDLLGPCWISECNILENDITF